MSLLTIILLAVVPALAQDYPFAKEFVNGTIILKDSTRQAGQVKWFPHQNEKLRFRENEKADAKKYSPDDLLGFTADSLQFVSLFNLEVYAESYPLLGKISRIKHSFGELISRGRFNIYFVLITGYDAVGGSIQRYPNYIFEKKTDSISQYAAFPVGIRMKEKRIEKAKESLLTFFKDDSVITGAIQSYKQQDDFSAIIKLIKTAN